jgi:hypothetical protein
VVSFLLCLKEVYQIRMKNQPSGKLPGWPIVLLRQGYFPQGTSGNVSELNSQGKDLPLESDSELRVDELAAGGGEGYKYQCALNRPNRDFMQFWEGLFLFGQKVSQMDF